MSRMTPEQAAEFKRRWTPERHAAWVERNRRYRRAHELLRETCKVSDRPEDGYRLPTVEDVLSVAMEAHVDPKWFLHEVTNHVFIDRRSLAKMSERDRSDLIGVGSEP
jgi:hypothetical protein